MNIKFITPYLVILLWTLTSNLSGQEINFKHISYQEGLVQSPISNFLQDDKGFIWFGNLKGLIRYDGYEFKTFVHEVGDKNSLSNNRVNCVFQDSDENLWVGTANGLNLYDRNNGVFIPIDILEIKGGRNYVSSITEDHHKNIWVGTFAGLWKLDRKTKKLISIGKYTDDEALFSKPIFSLYRDHQNNIWAGTKSGLRKYDPLTGKALSLPAIFASNPDFLNAKVLVTKRDSSGNYWFGTESSGLYCYQPQLNSLKHYESSDTNNSLPSNWVKDILIYDATSIWFATRNGISILNPEKEEFTNYRHSPLNPNSLNDNTIWSFLKDKASCVWIGTFAGGINFYYKGNSNFLNIGESIGGKMGLNHILVNAISEDADGSLWVGTFGGGLNHINRLKNSSEYYSIRSNSHKRPSNGIRSLADDNQGHLWIGTLDGLSLFDKVTKTFKHFSFPVKDGKLSENLINVVFAEGEGAWVGTNGGGLRYVLKDGSTSTFLKKKPKLPGSQTFLVRSGVLKASRTSGYRVLCDDNFFTALQKSVSNNLWIRNELKSYLSDNFVTALIKDESGNLWIGTQDGLNYYDPKAGGITEYRKVRDRKYQLSNNNITTLFIDSRKRLWIGTEGGGLNYFDQETSRFYSIGESLGLGDNVIRTIVEDVKGNLWVSTDRGLYRLKIKHFSIPFSRHNVAITAYSANDGLVSNQFSTNAGLRLKSNEIIFGGINGLSIFYPDRIIKNPLAPKVELTQLLINNRTVPIDSLTSPLSRSISETDEIKVDHDQANLSFKYSALNFINPENNQYAYKLEGLNRADEWQLSGNQRIVNFANLAPGTYLFKVKAANNDGVWGAQIRSLKIIVLPPWWQTWWAYLIYFLVFTVVAAIVINFLRNRARLKRDLYLEHMYNERQQELYQLKLNFFTNISHEIRTPLTLILGPLERLMTNELSPRFSNQLGLIKNNAERLMKLVTELLDFRKAEEGHMQIHCSYNDIIPFCREIYDSFKELAFDKNIDYRFLVPENPLFIFFDKNQLEKVAFNLLTNAFKFTEQGGKIIFSIQQTDDKNWVEIKVADNGKSIPKEMQDKLFENFFQVEYDERQTIGTGIGLALSKSIVELHKGKIKVECTDTEPSLTTFTVSLRTGRDHLENPATLNEQIITREIDNIISEKIFRPAEVENETSSASTKKYTLLIAEDNEEVRNHIVDHLRDDYHIIALANGVEALEHMKTEIPDLIISDIMMPEMDGLEFCRNTKMNESTNHIPFILLTARASVSHQADGLETGADVYISKPFSPRILSLNIKNLLKAQEVMREKFSQQLILGPRNITITSPEEVFINKLLGIIEENMDDSEFDVNELVNEIGISRTVLYKKVQTLTNHSVADLIKEMRLKKAAELLKTNSFPVAEIAYMVGFNDRKHFSKEFKKQYSMSPTEFMQAQREN